MPDKKLLTGHYSKVIITVFFIGLFLAVLNTATNAASCNQYNLFLSSASDVLWGDGIGAPGQVSATPNSTVRLSVSGEDGCAGQTLTFSIVGTNSTFQGRLTLGRLYTNNKYQLYYDWQNNLQNGTYQYRVLLPVQTGSSANSLVVGDLQQCNISRAYADPNGGIQGDRVRLTVEAQGTCQGWEANINVWNALTPPTIIWRGSQQIFSGTNNVLTWDFTLPNVPTGAAQVVYYFTANLGSQTLQSPNFISCRDATVCSGAGGNIPPARGGETQNIEWGIENPFITPSGGTQPQNIFDAIILITDWILNIAGSLIVILIIYGGVMFLISAGNPGKITQAKNILKWAFVGFAVTLIGKGFVYLVESVLRGDIPTFL